MCSLRGQYLNARVREGSTKAEDTRDGYCHAGPGQRESNTSGVMNTLCVCVCVSVCVYVCLSVCMYVSICVCVSVFIGACVCIVHV